jgi:hypothetical protein
MISHANVAGHVKGVVSHLIPGGISHLQFADDTMLLIEPSNLGSANLKLLLLSFENMSRLKINLSKNEVVIAGVSDEEKGRMADLPNCKLGSFPITYLGMPVSNKALRVLDWAFLTGKVGHRVNPWQGLFLASARKLELTNSYLSSLRMFAMSLYLLYDATHAAFDKVRSRFFWEEVGPKHKYHMVDWATVCKPKEYGGLGILNTRRMNIALMLKWIWKLYQNAEGLWVDLLKAKYLGNNELFSAAVPRKCSQFWNSIQKINWYFKLGEKHQVKSGKRTYFWLDWWSGSAPLCVRYLALFNICAFPFITVKEALNVEGWGILFRRLFDLPEVVEWDNLTRESLLVFGGLMGIFHQVHLFATIARGGGHSLQGSLAH